MTAARTMVAETAQICAVSQLPIILQICRMVRDFATLPPSSMGVDFPENMQICIFNRGTTPRSRPLIASLPGRVGVVVQFPPERKLVEVPS